MPSIMPVILEKSTDLALSAVARKVNWDSCERPTCASETRMWRARRTLDFFDVAWRRRMPSFFCTRAVFLNRSRLSSSFRMPMASLIAATSSARIFWRSLHSAFLAAHCEARSPRNFSVSATSASVSSRSSAV